MGHSRLCGFDGRLKVGTKEYQVGIESIKQAKGFLGQRNIDVNGFEVEAVYLWPQTARAKRMTYPGDYIRVNADGVSRRTVEQSA